MKKIMINFAVKVLQFINLFFIPFSLKKKVVIISRQADEPTLDIKLLMDCLSKNGIKNVVITKTLKKSLSGIVTYSFSMIKQMYHIATSKVIVIDGYCILVSILPKKKQKVIQMWHAMGAIKKFGWQNIDNPDGHGKEVSEAMNMHGNYDYVLAPGKITGDIFAEAFHVSKDKIVLYGLPRIDFIRENNIAVKHEMQKKYPEIIEKKNVLYVPTFRKNSVLELERLIAGFDFKSFNLIIKKHFLDKGNYIWAEEAGAIVDLQFSSMEWLRVCDKIVTDYSAIAFEAAIAEKELFIYQPDANEYDLNVGLNVNMSQEAIGAYVCKTEEELFEKLEKNYDQRVVKEFCEKYIEVDLNDCTQRFCGFIAKLLAE